MKINQVKKIIESNLSNYKQKLKLEEWDIEVDVQANTNDEDKKEANGHTLAEVDSCLYQYKAARLIFYADHLDTKKEVLDTLTHELLHIILSPYNLVEESMAFNFANDQTISTMLNIKNFCEELVIKHLESLLLGRM